MPNKFAEKIQQRIEKIKENQTPPPIASPLRPNKIWFWLFFIVLASVIGFLLYQAYSSNFTNELIIPIAIVVILLLVLIIWYLPKFYVQSLPNEAGKTFDRENAKLKLEDDTRKTFAQIVGGAVLLGGLVFTFNTFRLQQEGQFTDRFTKAVAQIGDDKLEVRLGGLYALERISKDSPKDYWTVMEILSAYVREKAKRKDEVVKNTESSSSTNANNQTVELKEIPKIATDVQTVLTIIGRRKIEQDSNRLTDSINLNGVDLHSAELQNINLSRVSFVGSNLSNAMLFGTNINLSFLVATNLSYANLSYTNLSGSSLVGANLRGANFDNTILGTAQFDGADLRDAKSLKFEQFKDATISQSTQLPDYLENRKLELLEISKENSKKIEEIIKRLKNQ